MSRFAALLESAPDAIVLVDHGGLIRLVNRRTEDLFGYQRSELLGETVEKLVPARLRMRHLMHRAAFASDPQTREMGADLELYARRKDGSEFPVEISLSPITDEDGRRVITIIRDVSERRRAEARFRVLLESAPDAILLVNESGRIDLANRRAGELFGYSQSELLGTPVESLVPERFAGKHVEHRNRYTTDPRTREMGADLDLYGRRRDGTEFPVEIQLSPMSDDGEHLTVTIVRDVSARRVAERERLELAREQAARAEAELANERLSGILAEIDVIVWEADIDRRRFTFVSARAQDMLGYPTSRWIDEEHFWRAIVDPQDLSHAEEQFRQAIELGENPEYEYRAVRADGQVVWLRDHARVVAGADGEMRLSGVTGDVTRRRDLEGRLLQSQKMDAVGQLAGGVAHDFNNLLVVISGYTEILLGRVTGESSLEQLREIAAAADRAGNLISQLLAFARRAPSVARRVDLNALTNGLQPMLRRLIEGDIRLSLDLAPSVPDVNVDPGQLEQVLVNLVINARDAMPLGGEVRIMTACSDLGADEAESLGLAAGTYVVLDVADDGSGMTQETKEHIFEPFFTTKATGKGTGLGLATVYGIVEQAGGSIALDTAVGRGTSIAVYLPRATSTTAVAEDPQQERGPLVLVVEDETAVRHLIRSILEDSGYRILEAGNGREALASLQDGSRPDLVLTDVVMPDVTGPELVSRLSELHDEIPVLFMSGYADSQLLNRGVSEEAVSVLRKPFTSHELTRMVGEALSPPGAPRAKLPVSAPRRHGTGRLDGAEAVAARAEHVRLLHAEDQHDDQRDVDGADEHAVAWRHAVVGGLLERAGATLLPAPERLHRAEQDDDQQDRVGEHEHQGDHRPEADEPHPWCHRGHRATAVEWDDGHQVEEVQEEPDVRERTQQVAVQQFPGHQAHSRAERPEDRPRETHAGLRERVLAERLRCDHSSQERDEHRRTGTDALPAQLEYMAHLVDEQQDHEAHRELPAPQQRVGRDGHERRTGGRQQLEVRQQQQPRLDGCEELRAERDNRRERTPDPPTDGALPVIAAGGARRGGPFAERVLDDDRCSGCHRRGDGRHAGRARAGLQRRILTTLHIPIVAAPIRPGLNGARNRQRLDLMRFLRKMRDHRLRTSCATRAVGLPCAQTRNRAAKSEATEV